MERMLNQTATKILQALIDQMGSSTHLKIDNTNGLYMSVVVESLGEFPSGTLYSVAHYGEQNGDLMRDPDMEFLCVGSGAEKAFVPVSFRNDYLPIHQVAMEFNDDGTVKGYRRKLTDKLVEFANGWMQNIADQQGIKI